MNNSINLRVEEVGKIKGIFRVPSYQRGYRWGKDEVERLLDDISANLNKKYCLQPIVVRKNGEFFDLVDGQQRLTTIFLIYKYIMKEIPGLIKSMPFSLTYETREKSEAFLKKIDKKLKDDNIDFFYIYNAFECIEHWFKRKIDGENLSLLTKINTALQDDVMIIWYEVGEEENPIELFTRLNIGKIPLTSAELVKAMFLNSDSNTEMTEERQLEISLQWDNMERELHNSSFWYFLTNFSRHEYQTHIDLVLDLISEKKEDDDKYFTFFEFDRMREAGAQLITDIWQKRIQRTFLTLKDWFEDHDIYHKVGYLIASESLSLLEIYKQSLDKTKTEFAAFLDEEIKKSVDLKDEDYSDLSYEKSDDREKIKRLLLLFNVISVMNNEEQSERFPFDKYKEPGKNVTWSLEHIHAQHSQPLTSIQKAHEWLDAHLKALIRIDGIDEELIDDVKLAIKDDELKGQTFERLQERIFEVLGNGNDIGLHSIGNMALLKTSDNATLNNSAFDAKRIKIIEMDMKGQFIPLCTKNVFFKYYNTTDKNSLHFWGLEDQRCYVKAINKTLGRYGVNISFEQEEQ